MQLVQLKKHLELIKMSEKQKAKRYALIALIATKQAVDYDYSTGVSADRVVDFAKVIEG